MCVTLPDDAGVACHPTALLTPISISICAAPRLVAAALTIAPDGESITLTVKPLPPPKPSAAAASEAAQPPGADAVGKPAQMGSLNPSLNPADSGPLAGGSPTSTTTTAHIAEGGSVHGGQSAALDLLPAAQQVCQGAELRGP